MTVYDILLATGTLLAALAVGAVCGLGLLVWLAGRSGTPGRRT